MSVSQLPRVQLRTDDPTTIRADALVVPVFRGGIEGPGAGPALAAAGFDEVPRDAEFRGRLGQLRHLDAPALPCGRVTLVGLGRMDELDDEQLRRAAGATTRGLGRQVRSVATTVAAAEVSVDAIRAVTEGVVLGAACADGRGDDPTLADVSLLVPTSLAEAGEAAVRAGTLHAHAQCLARELADPPASHPSLGARVAALADADVAVEVSEGSQLLRLHHAPPEPVATVALVGLGLASEARGLAGAAAVAATVLALPALDVPVAVVGLCPMVDADGESALAHALAQAAELAPDAIVDVAALPTGLGPAIGDHATGVYGNDDDLLRQLLRAAEAAGEPTWHLPLWRDLRDDLGDGTIGRATDGRGGDRGAAVTAASLHRSVDDQPWAHLDVGGPAWARVPRHHLPAGGTGTAVRTLLRWLEQARA